jgi:hypothetical protein
MQQPGLSWRIALEMPAHNPPPPTGISATSKASSCAHISRPMVAVPENEAIRVSRWIYPLISSNSRSPS